MVTQTPEPTPAAEAARDWRERIGRPSDDAYEAHAHLPAPGWVTARAGTGYVLLDWAAVEGAIGYLLHGADGPDGPFEPVDHLGGDVLAVPYPPYADTTADGSPDRWYAVATWTEAGPGPLSEPVRPAPRAESGRSLVVEVDAAADAGEIRPVWRRVLGSEHLSLLATSPPGPGGSDTPAELATALRMAHQDLGVEYVRAHGSFLPEMVQRTGGRWDFTGLDRSYDRLLEIGLRPVVELSFMPAVLARDPSATVFHYSAIVSPPADWDAWGDLCVALVEHLRDRYGAEEVRTWLFEVWNEANLEVFWSGTQEEYFRLYDVSARAVKSVDASLRVGGPSSARAEWVGALLEHASREGTPVDFVSTHTYGNAPLDFRPLVDALEPRPEIWWTEWGVTPTHGHPVSDTVFAAAFLLHGVAAALDSTDALGYWVVSDQFEELGWPPALFHGGFGLLTVGNLRKPRWWALELLNRLGPRRLPAAVSGDGEGLVEALAASADDGSVCVLLWNSTLDQGKTGGDARLNRTVALELAGLSAAAYSVSWQRVDETHANIVAAWRELGSPTWPDDTGWAHLRAADRCDPEASPSILTPIDGRLVQEIDLPMPGICLVTLVPSESR
ncbi:MAG: hypothetical protein WCB04_10955 [Mycobacteriales bacterium]